MPRGNKKTLSVRKRTPCANNRNFLSKRSKSRKRNWSQVSTPLGLTDAAMRLRLLWTTQMSSSSKNCLILTVASKSRKKDVKRRLVNSKENSNAR